MSDDPRKARIIELMKRYNQIGELLNDDGEPYDEESLSDPAKLAQAKVLLAEMDKVRAEFDGLLGAKPQ